MKIGILTHHYVKNFGAYMQALALIKVIKEHKPEAQVELIDYRVKKHAFLTSAHFFGFKPKRGDTIRGFAGKLKLLFTHAKYENKLPRSKRVRTAEEINAQNYDLIIVGSDEVWNFNDIAYDPIKFGKGLTAPMITYSASAGGSSMEDDLPTEVKEGISKFRAVAARDDKTAELVKCVAGIDAERTLDPVFLYDYELVAGAHIKKIASVPYLLIYDCRFSEEQSCKIESFAECNGLKIVGAGEYRKWYDFHTTAVTPFEWAYLFKNARAVITGTFHGASFSIKYNRNFAAYLTEPNRISKVGSLLKEFDLTEQIVCAGQEDRITEVLERDIDYSRVDRIIEKRVAKSKEYLSGEIDKI